MSKSDEQASPLPPSRKRPCRAESREEEDQDVEMSDDEAPIELSISCPVCYYNFSEENLLKVLEQLFGPDLKDLDYKMEE